MDNKKCMRLTKGNFFKTCIFSAAALLLTGCQMNILGSDWSPAKGPLMTEWAKDVSPRNAHPEYPRPQIVRESWLSLNGLWEYAIRPKNEPTPISFDGKILVPYPIESSLSGISKRVGEPNRLWYRRSFEVPKSWKGKTVLLNFEAVDWHTLVLVNGIKIGEHKGGYDPFSFDITDALKEKGPQVLVLAVWDPTDAGGQARGKQVKKPHGIWYTPTTGIWQSVWLEPVNKKYIESIKIESDIDSGLFHVQVQANKADSAYQVKAELMEQDSHNVKAQASGKLGRKITIPVESPKLWSPESPYLYELRLTLIDAGKRKVDSIKSYAGMRKIAIKKDENGVNRLFLNNKPLFQYGTLDQGFWPDGLYTAPTDEALKYDIEVLKKLGFNMLRKHVKIEPRRYYYWCDRLGILVWQDMPSADNKTETDKNQFHLELRQMIKTHYNHPSIIMWVLFNEGWGQHETERLTKWIKLTDPKRLVNNASGWTDKGVGDVRDLHEYPGPVPDDPGESLEKEPDRAVVLGEFGGLGLPIPEHTWQSEENWGYKEYTSREELTDAYLELLRKLQPMIKDGLSAAIYTQTTDVEIEVNGIMTYDRAIIKPKSDEIMPVHKQLYFLMPEN